MKRRWMWTVAIAALSCVGLALAGGRQPRGGPGGERRGGFRDRMREMVPEDIRELFAKRRGGEQLTEEENQKLTEFGERMRERFREMRERRGQEGGRYFMGTARRGGPRNPMVRLKLNPADAALQAMAEVQLKAQQFEKAVETLERMTKSPDINARDSAHFNIATICRRNLGDTDRAIAEYRKVGGPLALRAWTEILSTCDEMGEFDKGVAVLEEILAGLKDKGEKTKLLNLIARGWDQHGQPDKAAEALQRVVGLLPYGLATGMKELYSLSEQEWRKLQPEERPKIHYRPFDEAPPRRPGMQPGGPERVRGERPREPREDRP